MSAFICVRGRGKGNWWPLKIAEGQFSAELYCPNCALCCTMVNHKIALDGTVAPSFVECADKERCGKFHQNLILEGWTEFIQNASR